MKLSSIKIVESQLNSLSRSDLLVAINREQRFDCPHRPEESRRRAPSYR